MGLETVSPGSAAAAAVEDASFDFGENVTHIEGEPVRYSASGLSEARAAIGRMRGENRAQAEAFLDYAIGLADLRPEISPELERRLAEHGVVDPQGFSFDEHGRDLGRAIGGRKKLYAEPASLREYRLRRRGEWRAYEQPAFHGSPYSFERFSLQKLGTGEGDQAFGWGLYFAGHQDVAEFYRRGLTARDVRVEIGKPRRELTGGEMSLVGLLQVIAADRAAQGGKPEPAQLLDQAREVLETRLKRDRGTSAGASVEYQLQRLEQLKPSDVAMTFPGAMYQVEVPESHELLDYDKPLSEQPAAVREALARLGITEESLKHHPETPSWTRAAARDMPEGSGARAYQVLVERTGSPRGASEALLREGVPGLQYLDAFSRRAASGSHNFVIWDEGAVRDTRRLYQPAAGDGGEGGGRPPPRGSITFRVSPAGEPVEFRIDALRGDKSTLAHEMAHFLSWSLHSIATSDLASPDIRGDYDTVLKWMGYESAEHRVREQDAAREEKFSHAWEQYLAEGRAPSRALARVFSRFAEWMLRIYRGLRGISAQYESQYGQPLELSDEVRGVFDRMLAVDESLAGAREEAGMPPGPDPDVERAMTPAERGEYRRAIADARSTAEAEVSQLAAELNGPAIRAARARVEADVATVLDGQQRYKLWRFLETGELADGRGGARTGRDIPEVFLDEAGQPLRLSREAVEAQQGPEVARKLGPLLAREGGVTPDELAPLFGFDSGEELVSELYLSRPRGEVLAEETQARMEKTYTPALQKVQAGAMGAIHGDAQAHVTLQELRQLAKEVHPAIARRVHSIDLDTLKASAGRMVGETPVGALNPERYLRSERATALRAARLWGAGEKEAALDEKEAALFNQVLYRAARDTQAKLEKARADLEGISDNQRATLGKADPSYRDVHDALLRAVELGPGPEDLETALGLDAMLARAREDFQELDFDVPLVRALLAEPAPWDRLTADEAQAVADASVNIRTAARRRTVVTLDGKEQTKEAFFQRMREHLAKRKPLPPEAYTEREKTLRERATGGWRGVMSELMDVGETLAHLLDAGVRDGPAHELLVDARLAARDQEAELTREVLEKVEAAYRTMPEEMKKLAGTKVPGLEQLLPMREGSRVRAPTTRDALFALYLNSGNEGNKQRLRDGNGWAEEQMQKALNLLHPEEARFLQGVLDVVDQGLWAQLSKVYEARTGLPLEKVHATPIRVGTESYRGGYFPLRYDERASRPGELQADADSVAGLFQGNYRKPSVSSGHTKERQEVVKAAVLLDWNVLPAHLAQVIHDVSYGDWVRQAGGLVLSQDFKDLAEQYLGPERRAQLVPWLQDVANARADSAAGALSQATRTLSGFARGRLAVAALGFNVKAFALHTFDPWKAAWEDVGWGRIGAAYLKVMAPWRWGEYPEFHLSKEIASRETNFREDLRRTLSASGLGEPGLWRKLGETQFRLYEWIDRFAARVTFKAAYDGARAEGLTGEALVRRADDAVRRTLASHDIAEKPRLMRSKSGLGALVMFYGYANRGWNQRYRARDDIARMWGREDATPLEKTGAVASYAANYAAKMMLLSVIGVGAQYLSGRGPKKKDDPAEWAITRLLMEPLHEWPFIGAIAEKAVQFRANGDFFVGRVDARTEPGLAYLVDTINRLGEMTNKARGTASTEEKLWVAVDVVLGATLGGQVAESADYLHKMATGQTQPRGPFDVAGGVLEGEKKEPVHNPFTDIQDRISR